MDIFFMRHIAGIIMIMLSVLACRADGITVELLTVGPGEQFFQVHGHAALRVTSEGSDSVYSFETDPGRPAVVQYLAGNHGSIVAESASKFLDSIGSTGRGIKAYTLNLSPSEADSLAMMLRSSNGRQESRFNIRSANCTTQLFDLIDSVVAPSRISPGQSPVYELPAARFYTDTLRENAPWVSALITVALGSASDDTVTAARSISPLLFDDQYRHFTIMPEGRPFVARAREIHRRSVNITPAAVTPVDLAIALAAILLIATVLSVRGIKPEITATLDRISFGVIFIVGALIAFATFTPYSVGNGGSWSLTVLNPLIIVLPALRRHATALRIITAAWSAWLLIFAIFGPTFTAESLAAVRIISAALAIRIATYRGERGDGVHDCVHKFANSGNKLYLCVKKKGRRYGSTVSKRLSQ
ncbi:MAG: DUF4105 domain-containing protein [Duncaniella sp.]|nr:DUF4105 domain-containing protein [Duncaniella sp.]